MGRKSREPVEKLRVLSWFKQIKIELQADSAGEVAVWLGDAKTSSRLRSEEDAAAIRKFERWQSGNSSPSRSDILSIHTQIGREKSAAARDRIASAYDFGPHDIWPCFRLPCQVDDPCKLSRKDPDAPLYSPSPTQPQELLVESLESSEDEPVNYDAEKLKDTIEIFMTAFERLLLAHRLDELSARREQFGLGTSLDSFYRFAATSFHDVQTAAKTISLTSITPEQLSSTVLAQAAHIGSEFYPSHLVKVVRKGLNGWEI